MTRVVYVDLAFGAAVPPELAQLHLVLPNESGEAIGAVESLRSTS